MSTPMTPERRAEIREAAQPGYANILAQLIKHGAHDDPKHGKVIVHGVTVVPAADLKAAVRVVWFGAPALLVEVERLRAELAKTSDHRDYLHKRLEKVTKEANGRKEYGQRLRAELALWEATRPHVLWLRAELAETTHALTVTGEKVTAMRGQRDRAVAERDRLTRHAVRLRHAWDSARQRARGYRQAGEWVVAERDRLAEQVKRVREVAAYFRDREAHLKERYEQAANDAQATALLSSAALTGDAAHRIECALDGTEASS